VGDHEILKPDSCRFRNDPGFDPPSTLTYDDRCSLIDLLQKHYLDTNRHPVLGLTYKEVVGAKANIFLSFAYMDNFADLVDAMELFLDTNASQYPKESTYFWFDMLVNSQWGALDKDFVWWATTFKEAVVEIGKTVCFLSPWSNPTIFSRAWCLLEICYSEDLSIILSKTEESRFHSTLRSGDITGITTAVGKIDLEKANCYIAAEKKTNIRRR